MQANAKAAGIGPSTPNTEIADYLSEALQSGSAQGWASHHLDALYEAEERLRELGDDSDEEA